MTDDSDICGAECSDGSSCQRAPGGDADRCYQHNGNGSAHEAYAPETVADAIRQVDGNLSEASDILGCCRQTVHEYVNRHDICAEARDDARGSLVDLARSTYREILEDDEASDRDRLLAANKVTDKYDESTDPERREVSGPDGGPIETDQDHTHAVDPDDLVELVQQASDAADDIE